MCEFVSWIEKRDKIYFLTDKQLFETDKGKEFIKTISIDDLCGHGTIRAWYGIDSGDGIDKECVDFSSPDNFPEKIADAIKRGDIRGIGIAEKLLTQPVWEEYQRIKQTALAEYQRIEQTAWAEYQRIKQTAFWDLFANPENRNPSWR